MSVPASPRKLDLCMVAAPVIVVHGWTRWENQPWLEIWESLLHPGENRVLCDGMCACACACMYTCAHMYECVYMYVCVHNCVWFIGVHYVDSSYGISIVLCALFIILG